ncbi:MAG: hypothetical protein M0T84_04495 [Betaproteobacteria bacterium]|nr:hypothetical protein [Betaproteobacteria bacterium]
MNTRPPILPLVLLLLGMISLAVGVLAGLARLGVEVPADAAAHAWAHGALMVGGFLGTVIGLERAVALAAAGPRWGFAAPFCSALGALALLADLPTAGAQTLFAAAAAIFCAASIWMLRSQPAAYLATLALGAVAWFIGNLVWWVGGAIMPAVPWWIAFLVLTIAGERLELTRVLPTSPPARALFATIVAAMPIALTIAFWHSGLGLRGFAAALLGLAAWLLRHDIARRTVRRRQLTRYIALCLLAGYGWLAAGGLLGIAGGFEPGSALRDAALHALFLGFVMSMIFGHAPIIFPAVAKVRIAYHPAFYLPLVALHVSLLARVAGDLTALAPLTRFAGIANAGALLLFILTMATSVARGGARQRRARAPRSHERLI